MTKIHNLFYIQYETSTHVENIICKLYPRYEGYMVDAADVVDAADLVRPWNFVDIIMDLGNS